MFLRTLKHRPVSMGFPRVRGDVPMGQKLILPTSKFSPRARGCSEAAEKIGCPVSVFPACAGMFLVNEPAPRQPIRFPRVRGDVPIS